METGGDDHTATPEIIYSCPDFCVKTQKVVWQQGGGDQVSAGGEGALFAVQGAAHTGTGYG